MQKTLIVALCMVSATPTFADYTTWRTTEEEPQVIQQIAPDEVMYCRSGGFTGIDCSLMAASENGGILLFEKRPFKYELSPDGSFKVTNVIREQVNDYTLEAAVEGISAAAFLGSWGGQSPSWYQVVEYDANSEKGRLDYQYMDTPLDRMNFVRAGNALISKLANGISFYFLQVGDVTYALYAPGEASPAYALMRAKPYKFDNEAKCAQSYLNYLGFDVGRADGQPGPNSRAGSQAYLDEKPAVLLEPLSVANAEAWCGHFMNTVEADPGVVAVAGF